MDGLMDGFDGWVDGWVDRWVDVVGRQSTDSAATFGKER